jgi:hypothetical protein
MTDITTEYKVFDKDGFLNKVKELTRRFKVEITMVWGDSYTEKVPSPHDQDFDIVVTIYPVSVTFSFAEFKIDGYTYLGCIKDHDMVGLITIHGNDLLEGKNVSEWVKGFEAIPCNACNRKHSRKIGHLFEKDDTKEVMVFGSGCAKKYFGVNFDRVLSFFERFKDGMDDHFGGFGGFLSKYINTEKTLKDIYYNIYKYGYIPRSRAEYPNTCTTDDVLLLQKARSDGRKNPDDYDEITNGVDFTDVVTKSFTKDPNNISDFEHNIEMVQARMVNNLLTSNEVGILCWMVYSNFFQVKSDNVEFITPEGLKEGDRIEKQTVVFAGFNSFTSDWGVTNIYVFECDNVRYKWFTSVNVHFKYDVEVGDKLFIKSARVKKIEDDPKYGKSVIISRPSIHNL